MLELIKLRFRSDRFLFRITEVCALAESEDIICDSDKILSYTALSVGLRHDNKLISVTTHMKRTE